MEKLYQSGSAWRAVPSPGNGPIRAKPVSGTLFDMKRIVLSILLALLSTPIAAESPPGEIRFEASNLMSTADGTFHDWRIERAEVDPADLASGEVVVVVDVASLDTGITRRDEHLRDPDFFEVERWPTARVRVHGVRADGQSESGEPRYRADFDVRIRDVEKTLEGHFELTSRQPLAVRGELVIDRLEFGIGGPKSWWNPASIDEQIPVRFEARFPGR